MPDALLSSEEISTLRQTNYNATVTDIRRVHDDLAVFRVKRDEGFTPFEPGQYATLGLGYFESRLAGCQFESIDDARTTRMIRRAYSISCPIVESPSAPIDGLVSANEFGESTGEYEFYVALIREAESISARPPAFTPRLFALEVGDRLQFGKRINGHYDGKGIEPGDTVLMVGSGTGEAPNNAIIAELLSQGHHGPIVHVTTVRHFVDLAYQKQHEWLMRVATNYHYLPLTTREPINLDSDADGYVGKRYIQDLFQSGELSRISGVGFSPETTHVFLCGNPSMIGLVPRGGEPLRTPGMIQILMANGFTDRSHYTGPGRIRYEKYW
ncbi:MAG: ferredoxin--NADP reductase [Planctomycetota bacterium]